VLDCFTWRPGTEGPAPYQHEILQQIMPQRRVCIRGPHGLGKTTSAAWLIIWFTLTREIAKRDWKAITTASVWRQLDKYLWPEIHKWVRLLDWSKIPCPAWKVGQELLNISIKLTYGEAFAVASDTPSAIEGAHATSLLYIFDESKAVLDGTWNAAEGAFSTDGNVEGGEVFVFSISTPGEPAGRFYDIQSRKPGLEDWWVRHVTKSEAIAAGRMSTEWAEQRKRQWGEQSPMYQNRVEGNFAASDEDTIIPLTWIEQANERWQGWQEQKPEELLLTTIGVDVARSGNDATVLALRTGNVITELRRIEGEQKRNLMHCVGVVKGIQEKHGGVAVIDVVGIGAGVYDRLVEQGQRAFAFSAGSHSDARDRSGELGFADRRSEAWWKMREMLDPDCGEAIALPPHDGLTGDLTSPHWKVQSGGRIKVEGKDDAWSPDSKLSLRDRLGRSTDDGDAVVMAFAEEGGDVMLPFRM